MLQYLEKPTITQLHPVYVVQAGSIAIDAVVVVEGGNLLQAAAAACSWTRVDSSADAAATAAALLSSFQVVSTATGLCSIPTSINISDYQLSIAASDALGFRVIAPPLVLSAENAYGPLEGGTDVELRGSFSNVSDVFCAFSVLYSPAVYVSSETLQCTTPSYSQSGVVNGSVHEVPISIVYGAVEYPTEMKFSYYVQASLLRPLPTGGAVSGGYSVELQGAGFNSFG